MHGIIHMYINTYAATHAICSLLSQPVENMLLSSNTYCLSNFCLSLCLFVKSQAGIVENKKTLE